MRIRQKRRRSPARTIAAGFAVPVLGGLMAVVLALFLNGVQAGDECGSPVSPGTVALGPPGSGALVGATEYGGPGDPSSGTVGSSGENLLQHPDTYAELGGTTFQTATAMGGLPYLTPLRITWGDHSAIAYKRDFGLGGGAIDGLPRVIDLWWRLAGGLGIPYDNGLWSGAVRIERPPATGASNVLGQSKGVLGQTSNVLGQSKGVLGQTSNVLGQSTGGSPTLAPSGPSAGVLCGVVSRAGVPVTAGDRAQLLPDGLAAAPADAPLAVKQMIAAGNQIVGTPYLYGGGHGVPLSEIAPAYDCSSSVEHLLYGGRLVPSDFTVPSAALEGFGEAGPGSWVTLYANPGHVFMYVAGLRWDTHDAAGPGDGSTGIGWHPLIRSAAGFVARHPAGL